MNAKIKILWYLLIAILILWTIATFWVQYTGKEESHLLGESNALKSALIVYNPDPLYDLDRQVSHRFAEGLIQKGYKVKILTTGLAKLDSGDYDLFVLCANTYNWAPDWKIMRYIKNHSILEGRNVVAITLGAGSTASAKRKLDKAIMDQGAQLLRSESLWLMRPNDESRIEENNVSVATDMAYQMALEIED